MIGGKGWPRATEFSAVGDRLAAAGTSLASSGSNGCAQHGAKFSVMLYVPLATHGFTAGFAAFGIEQNPFPSSR
jgi:hypothetical protein